MNGFSFLRFALDLACPEIERANSAVSLLEQGTPMSDTAFELGYFDQAHLTNSLKRFIGKRPRKSLGKARLDSLRFSKTLSFCCTMIAVETANGKRRTSCGK